MTQWGNDLMTNIIMIKILANDGIDPIGKKMLEDAGSLLKPITSRRMNCLYVYRSLML
jgi:hypothetical protein